MKENSKKQGGKMNVVKTGIKIWGVFVGSLVFLLVLGSFVGRLLSGESDIGVFVGIIILGLMVSVTMLVGYWGWYKITRSKSIMKIFRGLPLLFIFALPWVSACTKVEPGYAGIRVNMYGSQKGVEDFPLVTGRVWYNPFTEDIIKFPTFLQTIVWTEDDTEGSPNDDSITFNSVEGAVASADISLSYSFKTSKVPALFVEFRRSAEEITNVYMRSQVRDSFSRLASTMKIVDIFGIKKQELLDKIKKDLQTRLGPKGFNFDMISFVGGLRVDSNVQGSINSVIQATQKAIEAENKVRQARAEADQKIETARGASESLRITAEGQATANRTVSASLNDSLIHWQSIQRWNGVLPQVTAGGIPLINIPIEQKK